MATLPVRANVLTSSHDGLIEFPAGSTHPPLRVELYDGDGDAVDVSDYARVQFELTDADGTVVVERGATVRDAHRGIVEFEWRSQETDTAGLYDARFVLQTTGGDTLKVPSRNPITVNIT